MSDFLDDFIKNPIKTSIDIAMQPLNDGLEIFEGLSEGEIREKAAIRLGADTIVGMSIDQIITAYLTSL